MAGLSACQDLSVVFRSVPGFASPSILFLSTFEGPEREFLYVLTKRLRERGFERVVDTTAGGFATTMVHVAAGWRPDQIETSDCGLYSTIMGYAATGQDLYELNVCVDGEPVPLAGDSVTDAAILLHKQLEMRLRKRPDSDYWRAMLRDVIERSDRHIASLTTQVQRQVDVLKGMKYYPMDLWQHMQNVADDPKSLVACNPPTYMGGFERFFDTGGRLTWNEPPYSIWDPDIDQARLAEEAKDWKSTILILQQAEPGHGVGDVVFARHLSRGQYVYLWTNQGDMVRDLMGKMAVPRKGDLEKPDLRVIPPDYEVKPDAQIVVDKITPDAARYCKELWLHKLTPDQASWNLGVFVDGWLAGIAGVSRPPPQTARNQAGNLLLVYATGAPHKDRLTRLVTMCAMSEPTLRRFVDAFQMAQVEQLITAELTHHPEIKGLRGLMKLHSRKKDPKHGFRLIYTSPLRDQKPDELLVEWLKKETQWRKNRDKQREKAAA